MPVLRVDDRPHGPAHYWSVMRELARFTAADIHGRSNGGSRGAVIRYVHSCLAAGYVTKVGQQTSKKGRPMPVYEVLHTQILTPPLFRQEGDRGQRQQQLWNAVRSLKNFTTKELAIEASTDTVPVSRAMACQYCTRLTAAGFLWLDQKRVPRSYIFNQARYSGRLAPSFRRNSTDCVDRNLGQAVNLNDPRTIGGEP